MKTLIPRHKKNTHYMIWSNCQSQKYVVFELLLLPSKVCNPHSFLIIPREDHVLSVLYRCFQKLTESWMTARHGCKNKLALMSTTHKHTSLQFLIFHDTGTSNTWQYRRDVSFPLNIFAINFPPSLSTWVTIVNPCKNTNKHQSATKTQQEANKTMQLFANQLILVSQ